MYWRQLSQVCEAQCCTFPHLLTASDWKDPASYVPHSGRQLFEGIKPFGAEDPMLWTQKEGNRTIIKAILHDEQGPSRETAIGRCPGAAPLSWPPVWALPLTRGRHLDSRKKAKLYPAVHSSPRWWWLSLSRLVSACLPRALRVLG